MLSFRVRVVKKAMDKTLSVVVRCGTAAVLTFAVSRLRKRSRRKVRSRKTGIGSACVDFRSITHALDIYLLMYL